MFILKILSGNEFLILFKDHNFVTNKRKMTGNKQIRQQIDVPAEIMLDLFIEIKAIKEQ